MELAYGLHLCTSFSPPLALSWDFPCGASCLPWDASSFSYDSNSIRHGPCHLPWGGSCEDPSDPTAGLIGRRYGLLYVPCNPVGLSWQLTGPMGCFIGTYGSMRPTKDLRRYNQPSHGVSFSVRVETPWNPQVPKGFPRAFMDSSVRPQKYVGYVL